jgi:uncharacterized membrane protein
MTLGLTLHVLGAIVWVGGMFFAYMVLRPVAGEMEGPVRLWLWRQVFGRFFPWVWASVLALLASGYLMLFWGLGGFAGAGIHVHIMQLLGWIMVLLFLHLYFAPWRRLQRALDAGDGQAAASSLNQIRMVVAINLTLGILTSAIGASGRWWG